MNISGLSSTANVQQDNAGPRPFQALASALKNGDLASAQQAFSDLQAKFQSKQGTQTKKNDGDGDDKNWNTLASALKSGDLAGAQQAFQAMQTKGAQGHHHHHKQPSTDSTNTVASKLGGSLSVDLSA